MAYCTECGSEVDDSQKFCHECGSSLETESASPTTPTDEYSGQNDTQTENESESTGEYKSSPKSARQIISSLSVTIVVIVVFAILALGIASILGVNPDTGGYNVSEVQSDSVSAPYDALFRNIDEYQGESLHEFGRVTQVIDHGDDDYTLLIEVTETEYGYEDIIQLNWEGERFLEGDFVEVYGVVEGTVTYETVVGAQNTVPEVTAVTIWTV